MFSVVAIFQPAIAAYLWQAKGILTVTTLSLLMALGAIFFLIPMKFNQFGNVDLVDDTDNGSKIMSAMKILFKSNILILVLIVSIGIDFLCQQFK